MIQGNRNFPECFRTDWPWPRLFFLRSQLLKNRKILQSRNIVSHCAAGGNLTQQAPHDLAGSGLWEGIGKADFIRPGERADLLGNVLAKFLLEAVGSRASAFKGHESNDCRSLQIVRPGNNRGLSDSFMRHQGTFNFGRAQTMTRDINHVINPAHDPEVTVLVFPRAVAGEINTFDLRPVLFAITLVVTVDRAQHSRPRLLDNEVTALIRADGFTITGHHISFNAGKRFCRRARLRRSRSGDGSNHDAASLSLPPGVDDRT